MHGYRRSPPVPPTLHRVSPQRDFTVPPTLHRVSPQRDFTDHIDPTEPFPEGQVIVPEACWFQHPEADKIQRFYHPERQWGDRRVFVITDLQTIAFGQLLDLKFDMPAVVSLRLSAVDISGTLAGPANALTVKWTVSIGCGRALQIVNVAQRVQPFVAIAADAPATLGSTLSDLQFQLPVQALRVSGEVVDTFAGIGNTYNVECVAMAAPFTADPGMVAR